VADQIAKSCAAAGFATRTSADSTAAKLHQHGATLRRLGGNAATAKPTPVEPAQDAEGAPLASGDREDVVVAAAGDTGGPSGIFG
jgi:hypothetical protein